MGIIFIQDIAYAFPTRIKLDAGSLNTACVASQQQPLGNPQHEHDAMGISPGMRSKYG